MTSITDAWADATDIVIAQLPGLDINFDWPGVITIEVEPRHTLLVFGTNADTIGADVNEWRTTDARNPAGFWDEGRMPFPDSLVSDVPSNETRPEVIASAILACVRAWQADRDPHMTFERDREFDRTHPGYWDWDANTEREGLA